MIQGIRQIGRGLLHGVENLEENFVEYLVEDLRWGNNKKNPPHLVTLKIDTNSCFLELDQRELGHKGKENGRWDINEERLKEYLWVGNASSNDDQDRVTTNRKNSQSDHLEYLISQTIPNLLKKDRLPNGELRTLLQKFREEFYIDLGDKKDIFGNSGVDGSYERNRYLWNLRKMGLEDAPTKDDLIAIAQKRGKAKDAVAELKKFLTAWISKELGLTSGDIALYTLELDGVLLAAHPDYKRYIFQRTVEEPFKNAPVGVCHLCGETLPVTANTKFLKLLKFYNTDKVGFASGLDAKEGFYRSYSLCQECYMALLAGEAFVRKNLRSNLAHNDVYVIPSFHLDLKLSPERLKGWAKYLKSYLGKLTSLDGWHKFQEKLEDFKDYDEHKASFLLNFLFVQRRQAEVRIQKLVQDVPPSRLDLLVEERSKIKSLGDRLFGESRSWDLSLGTIFWLFPVRERQREVFNADVLDLYAALFTGRPVKYGFLIANFLETSRMHHHENYGPYVHKPPQEGADTALVRFLLQSVLLIRYLQTLKMLKEDYKGGKLMNEFVAELPMDIKDYIGEMSYDGPQAGLFLLGYLIGQIGVEQHNASPTSKKKPILNKLNFMGMPLPKVQRLSSDIFEKLDQYRVLPYNEGVFAAMKALLDRNRYSWELTPQENVYYILSGYAYATWKAMTGAPQNKSVKSNKGGSK